MGRVALHARRSLHPLCTERGPPTPHSPWSSGPPQRKVTSDLALTTVALGYTQRNSRVQSLL